MGDGGSISSGRAGVCAVFPCLKAGELAPCLPKGSGAPVAQHHDLGAMGGSIPRRRRLLVEVARAGCNKAGNLSAVVAQVFHQCDILAGEALLVGLTRRKGRQVATREQHGEERIQIGRSVDIPQATRQHQLSRTLRFGPTVEFGLNLCETITCCNERAVGVLLGKPCGRDGLGRTDHTLLKHTDARACLIRPRASEGEGYDRGPDKGRSGDGESCAHRDEGNSVGGPHGPPTGPYSAPRGLALRKFPDVPEHADRRGHGAERVILLEDTHGEHRDLRHTGEH